MRTTDGGMQLAWTHLEERGRLDEIRSKASDPDNSWWDTEQSMHDVEWLCNRLESMYNMVEGMELYFDKE